jgi:hypothetical protein
MLAVERHLQAGLGVVGSDRWRHSHVSIGQAYSVDGGSVSLDLVGGRRRLIDDAIFGQDADIG